jgi:hypothetical protein
LVEELPTADAVDEIKNKKKTIAVNAKTTERDLALVFIDVFLLL